MLPPTPATRPFCTAGTRSRSVIATDNRGEREFVRLVGGAVVVKRPDHDVRVQRGEADEERAGALVLKARSVHFNLVEKHVIGLAGHISRGKRAHDHRAMSRDETNAIDRLEVTFDLDAVSDLNRSEASRIGND